MPEYSRTLPNGVVNGKFWSCTVDDGRGKPIKTEVGCYAEKDDEYSRVIWFDVELRSGPAPRGYSPPDWHNFEGWKRQQREAHTYG